MNYIVHYVPFNPKDKSNLSVLDQSYDQASNPECILSRLEVVLKSYLSVANVNTSTVYLIVPTLGESLETFISNVFAKYTGCKVVFVTPPKKCVHSNQEFHQAYVLLKFFYSSVFTEDDRFLLADLSHSQLFQSDPFEEEQLSTYRFVRSCIQVTNHPKMRGLLNGYPDLHRQLNGYQAIDNTQFFVNGIAGVIFLYYRILFRYMNLEEYLRYEVTFFSLLNLVVLRDKVLLKTYQGRICVA